MRGWQDEDGIVYVDRMFSRGADKLVKVEITEVSQGFWGGFFCRLEGRRGLLKTTRYVDSFYGCLKRYRKEGFLRPFGC